MSSNFGELIVNVQHIPQMGEARERRCWKESEGWGGGSIPWNSITDVNAAQVALPNMICLLRLAFLVFVRCSGLAYKH